MRYVYVYKLFRYHHSHRGIVNYSLTLTLYSIQVHTNVTYWQIHYDGKKPTVEQADYYLPQVLLHDRENDYFGNSDGFFCYW